MDLDPIERVHPLYKISAYGNDLYRVTKRLSSLTPSPSLPIEKAEAQQYDHKLDNNLARARTAVREYALCNPWTHFVTLTIDPKKYAATDLREYMVQLTQWFRHQRKRGSSPDLSYLLVPEKHQSGQWHLHGLMRGISAAPQLPGTPRTVGLKSDGSYYDCWPEYSARYGYSTVEEVKDPVAAAFYITKYITKTMGQDVAELGLHTYYHSRGLLKSLPVGYAYSNQPDLDAICKRHNEFYAYGFARLR